jgi:Phage integrase family
VQEWVASIDLDPAKFGTHSLRRTKAVLIYRRTGNLRAVQLLLGHTKIESTVRYLGIEVDDAIEITEKIIFELTRYTRQRTWSTTFYASPIPDGLKSASGMEQLRPLSWRT